MKVEPNVWLVRHGESVGNLDTSVYQKIPDPEVSLTERGLQQARAVGRFLATSAHFRGYYQEPGIKLWVSPYARAEQTADAIKQALISEGFRVTVQEEIALAEQQFGILDVREGHYISHVSLKSYPDFEAERAYYKFYKAGGAKFWARPPQGESEFDVAMRVRPLCQVLRDSQWYHNVVISHSKTLRLLAMQWLGQTVDQFQAQMKPANCSVRWLCGNHDNGYIPQTLTTGE